MTSVSAPPFLGQQIPVTLLDSVAAISLAFVMGFAVRWLYQRIAPSATQDPHFDAVLFFLAPILAVIMILIGSNLALSIGMVGSLSIIRFRNVIRSSRDMVFLFWLIAVGLGCGTFSYKVTLITFVLMFVMMLILSPRLGLKQKKGYHLVLRGHGPWSSAPVDAALTGNGVSCLINFREGGGEWEAMYSLSDLKSADSLLSGLRALNLQHVAMHEIP